MWRFDTLVGETALDSSSILPNNGTINGSVTLGDGKFGVCFYYYLFIIFYIYIIIFMRSYCIIYLSYIQKAAVFTGGTGDKVIFKTSPITNQMAHGNGFSVSMWFKGKDSSTFYFV
jgi:hypothetical protein